MHYDATDYVGETATAVRALLEREFGGAAAFRVEAAATGVEPAPSDYGRVVVTLRIWTFAAERDRRRAEERVPALAQKLEAVLLAAARDPAYPDWVRTEYLQTNYVTRRAGRPFRLREVPAGRTEWRVCLAARR
jgi:hypothetical protein